MANEESQSEIVLVAGFTNYTDDSYLVYSFRSNDNMISPSMTRQRRWLVCRIRLFTRKRIVQKPRYAKLYPSIWAEVKNVCLASNYNLQKMDLLGR